MQVMKNAAKAAFLILCASAGAVRGDYPAEAFAKGGDSDECRGVPSPSV
jgi:hypothetical protein